MGEVLKISVPAGYAMDSKSFPAGSDGIQVVLTVWEVDGHPAWEHEVSLALTQIQRLKRRLKYVLWGIGTPR